MEAIQGALTSLMSVIESASRKRRSPGFAGEAPAV